jgi:predicted nucleic acid-binding protein
MNGKTLKQSIYVESSVISYLTAKENRDLVIAARQKMTKNWWKGTANSGELFISTYVIDEISQGDSSASEIRLNTVKNCNLLPASDEISFLAKEYFRRMQIPDHAMYDSIHLACAVLNGIDIIVSWNFKHIANPTIRHILRTINDKLGYETPEITTPEELMEGDL